MWLIATDEAGYGPKLGPLVITATTWWVDDATIDSLAEAFDAFVKPVKCNGVTVRIDDSKAIYKPASLQTNKTSGGGGRGDGPVAAGLQSLHNAVSAASAMAGLSQQSFDSWLSRTADRDRSAISTVPWLAAISGADLAEPDSCRSVLDVWEASPARLQQIRSRVITAKQFNEFCELGRNKADLLSTATLGLVRNATQEIAASVDDRAAINVFCDRHGGRRYYAAVLQHVWADDSEDVSVEIVDEAKHESRYRLSGARLDVDVRFTVKGDRFTPVAMSSMIAKYTRERLMESFNSFFNKHHHGQKTLKATAGYPVDADRFLADVESIIAEQKILRSDLVRCR